MKQYLPVNPGLKLAALSLVTNYYNSHFITSSLEKINHILKDQVSLKLLKAEKMSIQGLPK